MSKLLFKDLMGNIVKKGGMVKGSTKAKTAGQKAAETRRKNREAGIVQTKNTGVNIVRERITFKALNESNYHKITIDTPVDIYIHKSLSRMYISPHVTTVQKND